MAALTLRRACVRRSVGFIWKFGGKGKKVVFDWEEGPGRGVCVFVCV